MRLACLLAALSLPAAAQTASVQRAPARVQIVHNSPDPALATLDVYLNEAKPDRLDNVAFRTATPYFDVEAGRVVSVVVAADTSTGLAGSLAVSAFVAESGVRYQVIIEGLVKPYEFSKEANQTSRRLAAHVVIRKPQLILEGAGDLFSQRIDMLFLQGSPDVPAYTYDLFTYRGTGFFGFTAGFGSAVRANFPGADLHYRFRISGQPETDLTAERLNVHAGQTAMLMLSGFHDPSKNQGGPALGFFVVRESGAVESVWGDGFATPVEGRPDAPAARSVTVSPNPVAHRAALSLAGGAGADARVEVFDMRGRRVASEPMPATGPQAVETGAWPAGLYVARVTLADGRMVTGRFTVVR